MLTLVLFFIFVVVVALLMLFQGLWNNVITLFNVMMSALLATNFYEPIATEIDKSAHSYSYLLDFLILWGLFALSMTIFRLISEFASNDRVKFNKWVELAGNGIVAIWVAWIFISFAAMTFHTAPLPANPFRGAYAGGPNSVPLPDRFWLGFVRARSTGVFSNGNAFDQDDQFLSKYYKRRKNLEGQEAFLLP